MHKLELVHCLSLMHTVHKKNYGFYNTKAKFF